MNDVAFESLGLVAPILKAVAEQGYERPSPIQHAAIPSLLEGRDLLGCAQTGTGKTAAFALPIIQNLLARPQKAAPRKVRALVVAPTRELAAQIDESFAAYARHVKLSHACIFGGVGKAPQERALSRGLDVLVATPGRLLDLHGEGKVQLDAVEIFVLDEADRMLDMGFIHDMKKVIALVPKERQTLLFSATMPPSIAELAKTILRKPLRVDISPEKPTVEAIEQSVIYAEKNDKRHMLAALIQGADIQRALVFTRTKHGADRLVKSLERSGISAAAIHANKSQNNRIKTLEGFRSGEIRILVATDLAARGIDVDGITHVFNYELPNEPETYVHRIGRTARAGADGVAIALCESEEKPFLRDIERLIGKKIPTAAGPLVDEAFKAAATARAEEKLNPPEPQRPESGRRDRPQRRDEGQRRESAPRGRDASAPRSRDGSARGSGASRKGGGASIGEAREERSPRGKPSPQGSKASPAGRPPREGSVSRDKAPRQPRSGRKPEERKEWNPEAGTTTPRQSSRAKSPSRDPESPPSRPVMKKAQTGRAPSGSSGSGSRSNQDAIRNAIRDIARGEDDFFLKPKKKPEGGDRS